MSNVKRVVLGVVGGVLVLGTLGRLIYNDIFGTSDLLMFAPNTSEVSVVIDEDPPVLIAAGHSKTLEVRRGAHVVKSILQGAAYEVEVTLGSGGARYSVPVSANQCFALADVTKLYAPTKGEARIDERMVGHKVVKLPKVTVAGVENMPATRKAGSSALFVLQGIDCAAMAPTSDETLLKLMGL